MESLKLCGPFGSLDFQTLPFLGPLQKLLLPFIFRGSNIPAKKFKIGAIKQNKKPCQITIAKTIWMVKTTTVQK